MSDFWLFQKLSEGLVVFGLTGQFIFMLRFLVQWIASERRGRSYIPIAFWYISLAGGIMLFIYGLIDHDPVILLGQSLGLGIYLRNLYLIHSGRARYRHRRRRAAARGVASAEPETGAEPTCCPACGQPVPPLPSEAA